MNSIQSNAVDRSVIQNSLLCLPNKFGLAIFILTLYFGAILLDDLVCNNCKFSKSNLFLIETKVRALVVGKSNFVNFPSFTVVRSVTLWDYKIRKLLYQMKWWWKAFVEFDLGSENLFRDKWVNQVNVDELNLSGIRSIGSPLTDVISSALR